MRGARKGAVRAAAWAMAALWLGCSPGAPPVTTGRPAHGAAATDHRVLPPRAPGPAVGGLDAGTADGSPLAAASAPRPCPDDMVYVDAVHCPDTKYVRVGLHCLHSERDNPNHLVICSRFAPGQRCRVDKRRQRFCIDRYEYPSRQGAHPPVMVSGYDAAALCAERGKRLCWESEWTSACEGPELEPFPYGYARSAEQCNIDNRYIHPHLRLVHHPRDPVRGPELNRLDQSVPSGSMPGCRSGFGVYDLTGNFDEWVLTERRRGKSKWVGLKGGAWGHVRNACRPITTSHASQWSYYFISFRCCRDPDPAALEPPPTGGPPLWSPPPAPTPHPPPGRALSRGYTPPLRPAPGTVASER